MPNTTDRSHRELFEADIDSLSAGDLLGRMRSSDLLCERVIEACRTAEFGYRGRNPLYALKHVGERAFREAVRKALEGDDEIQVRIDAELESSARREVDWFLVQMPEEEAAPFRDRILNTQELAELRSVYRAVEREGRLVPGTKVYDFRHPARLNKDQLRTLENLHDSFALLLSRTFSSAMRAVVDVDTAFVDQTTYGEFVMSLSNPSCTYQFSLAPMPGRAILDFAMPLTWGFVDRVFGGKGSSQGVEPRQVSQLEMALMAKIVKRVVQDLEATWGPILPAQIHSIELETNPELMQITAESEIVILLAFEVNSTNASGLVSLCYPFSTLESIVRRLGQPPHVHRRQGDAEAQVGHIRAALGPAPVPMRVELGRNDIAVDEAQSLSVGDVICSTRQRTDPCVVHVGGAPKFYARPFAEENGRVSLQVVGRVPAELQPSLRAH